MENKFSIEDAVKKAQENIPVPGKEAFWDKVSEVLDKEMPERKPFFNKVNISFTLLVVITLFALWQAKELFILKKQFVDNSVVTNTVKQENKEAAKEPVMERKEINTISPAHRPSLTLVKKSPIKEKTPEENNAHNKFATSATNPISLENIVREDNEILSENLKKKPGSPDPSAIIISELKFSSDSIQLEAVNDVIVNAKVAASNPIQVENGVEPKNHFVIIQTGLACNNYTQLSDAYHQLFIKANVNISIKPYLTIQPGIGFIPESMYYSYYDLKDMENSGLKSHTVTNSWQLYLECPLKFQVKGMNVFAGLYYSRLLMLTGNIDYFRSVDANLANTTIINGELIKSEQGLLDTKIIKEDFIRKNDIGLTLGIGYSWNKIDFRLSYHQGCIDYNNAIDFYTSKNNFVPHRNLLIGIGYKFNSH